MARVKTSPRKTRRRRTYKNVRVEYVASYATRLLHHIKRHYSNVITFSREDLLHLKIDELEDVGTQTRYRKNCIAVAYLIDHGELIPKKSPDLCLAARAGAYHFEETPISTEYAPTIRKLISSMPRGKPFAVMHVVGRWKTDPQLTNDSKRKAVRNAIRGLAREGACQRLNDFEYQVGGGQDE